MRLLLDTHTLIWAVEQPSQLSPSVVTALQEPANDLLLVRVRSGNLPSR
jgi:PIN domain nuclease of toxin-antitoxin system